MSSPTYDGIPIRNLWLLMWYASDFYAHMGSSSQGVEQQADDLPHSLQQLFLTQCAQLCARPLRQSYARTAQRLAHVRGKIDMITTHQHALLDRGQVACQFEQLELDVQRYGYLYYVLEQLISAGPSMAMLHQLRAQLKQLKSLGIRQSAPHYQPQRDRFGPWERSMQHCLYLGQLLLAFHVPTQQVGQAHFLQPNSQSSHGLRQLFEKAMAGFYQRHAQQYQLRRAVALRWPEDPTQPRSAYLPHMIADMVLQHRQQPLCMLIDTKFTAIFRPGYYRQQDLLKSEYLYQLYSYIRSQEQPNAAFQFTHAMLLHPAVGQDVTEQVVMQGYRMQFCTVDLSQSREAIEQRLLSLLPHHSATTAY
jgi:5-methylcytosine-specific restriction enzyme subunit McrC